MTLPEPARRVWQNARDVIHDFFHHPGEPDRGIVLSGGTILAARLEHRSSTDIDVKLTSDNALRDIMRDPQALARLDEALRNAGLERVRQRPPLQIVYGGHAGELDLFEGVLAPPENVHWATIDGTPVAVASNGQIMTGKLVGRGARAPVRDIIDIAVTAHADREACERAINATPYDVLAILPTVWKAREAEFVHAIEADEIRLEPRWNHLRADPVRHAVRAIYDLAWRQVELTLNERGATFTGCRHDRRQVLNDEPIRSPGVLDVMFQALGVRYGIDPRTGLSRTATRMMDVIRQGGLETRLIKEVRLPGEPPSREAMRQVDRRQT